jgi:cobalt/nickel transport protein
MKNRLFVGGALTVAIAIALFISPLASQNPDGLDRVSQDLQFDSKASSQTIAQKLPFYAIFNEYSLRGLPEGISTSLAGLFGTLTTFGLAWGIGKLTVKDS